MSSVLEHRRDYLRLMRQFTQDKGFFTVTDIQLAAGIPRSTAQDWVYRLQNEGCVLLKEEKRGRTAARYAAISAMPASTCRRIFTTVDKTRVAIFHECVSGACAAFCGYHHTLAGGVLTQVERDGTLLKEIAELGDNEIQIGLPPLAAVGVGRVEKCGEVIIQTIRCIGGPAYSLSDMMARADGVLNVESHHAGPTVEGNVWTSACTHVIIGIDDTDTRDGGATFALALALLNHLSGIKGILPISHHVVMLNPDVMSKTAGNSASYIEIAVIPSLFPDLAARVRRFISDESYSPDWGIAIRTGFSTLSGLQEYGRLVRQGMITRDVAEATAERYEIALFGGNGVIGALGAIALAGLPHEVQLDPYKNDFI
jgi:hypothetical protein